MFLHFKALHWWCMQHSLICNAVHLFMRVFVCAGSWPYQPRSSTSPATTSCGTSWGSVWDFRAATSLFLLAASPDVRARKSHTNTPAVICEQFSVTRVCVWVYCSGGCDGDQPSGAGSDQDAVQTFDVQRAAGVYPLCGGPGWPAVTVEGLGTHCSQRCALFWWDMPTCRRKIYLRAVVETQSQSSLLKKCWFL